MIRRRANFAPLAPVVAGAHSGGEFAPRSRRRNYYFILPVLLLFLTALEVFFWNVKSMKRKMLNDIPPNPENEDECGLLHDWQLPKNMPMSCNLLHEMAMNDLEFINCGGDRCAFKVADT